jgi:hypothetical protein
MMTLLTAVLLASTQPAFQAETLGGERIAGRLVELSAEKVTLETPDGPMPVDVERLTGLTVTPTPPEVQGRSCVRVDLVDGSEIVAADYTAFGGRAQIAAFDGRSLDLSAEDVAAVRFLPLVGGVAGEWKRLLESRPGSDLLVVRKDDSIDYHRGVIGDVTGELVEFQLEADVLPVKRTKLQGLIYYRAAEREFGDAACRITDVDGSRWVARSLAMESGTLHWTTLSGLEVIRPLESVLRVDFSQGKVVYLSDLKPDSVAWTPYFGEDSGLEALRRFFGPREDRSLRSGPLELDGTPYSKGLALHSRTSLEYRLPGEFRRFKAVVGIDDRVRPRGNAQLVIRGDDRVLLDTTVAGTDPPRPVDLDLTGVRRLTILVDFGEDLDVADDVDLCEARVVK